MKDTGKVVLLKDLHNIAAQLKQHPQRNDLTILISQMLEGPGKYPSIKKISESTVMIDATYKLNNLRMPLFLLLIMVVALWIAIDESKDTLTHNDEVFQRAQQKSYRSKVCNGRQGLNRKSCDYF